MSLIIAYLACGIINSVLCIIYDPIANYVKMSDRPLIKDAQQMADPIVYILFWPFVVTLIIAFTVYLTLEYPANFLRSKLETKKTAAAKIRETAKNVFDLDIDNIK